MLTLSLCLFALCLRAQQADRLPLAKCAYLYFSSGQGDSLRSMLSDEMQAALPADALGAMFNQLVAQFGPLQSAGEWHQVEAGGLTVCYRDLTFEKYALRFQAAFDGDGRIAGLFVKPAPKFVPAPAASPDSLAVVETDTAVVCGTFRLPATLTLPRRAVEEGRRVPCVGAGAWLRPARPGRGHRPQPSLPRPWHGDSPHGASPPCATTSVPMSIAPAVCPKAVSSTSTWRPWTMPWPQRRWPAPCPGWLRTGVYVLGHSQGGWLAPRIAARDSRLAGLILLAAPARPLEDLLLEQVTYLESLAPSAKGRQQVADLQRRVEECEASGHVRLLRHHPLPVRCLPARIGPTSCPIVPWRRLPASHSLCWCCRPSATTR